MGRSLLLAVKRIAKRGSAQIVDNLDGIESLLRLGQASAGNVPFLPGAFDVVLELVTLARKARDGRERSVQLVQRVGHLMIELNDVLQSDALWVETMRDPDSPLARCVTTFSELLQRIRTDMIRHASGISFYSQGRTILRLAQYEADLHEAQDTFNMKMLAFVAARVGSQNSTTVAFPDGGDADAYGLRWPQVRLGGSTNHDLHIRSKSWWSDTYIAEALGERLIVKQYSASLREQFESDKEFLKSFRHPNFPQLFGHSIGNSAPFFLAIKTESVLPLGQYLDFLCNEKPESALCETYNKLCDVVQAFRDLRDKPQAYRANLVIDENRNVLVGGDMVWSRGGRQVRDDNWEAGPFAAMVFVGLYIRPTHRPLHALLRAEIGKMSDWGHIHDVERLRKLLLGERRACAWPNHGLDHPDTGNMDVGDIGHVVVRNGGAHFQRLCHVQDIAGTHDEVRYEHVRQQLLVEPSCAPPLRFDPCDRIWIWGADETPRITVYLGLDKPERWTYESERYDIARRFLSRHARRIGHMYGLPAENVMLIVAVRRQLAHVSTAETETCPFRYHFAHWDANRGTPTYMYGRPTKEPYSEAQLSEGPVSCGCSLGVIPDDTVAPLFVQLEPEELQGEQSTSEL